MANEPLEIIQTILPDALRKELERWRGTYTNPRFLYHSVWTEVDMYVGVFGDGPNGSYEWFVRREARKTNDWRGRFRTSNSGYGSDCAALRDVLVEAGVMEDRRAIASICAHASTEDQHAVKPSVELAKRAIAGEKAFGVYFPNPAKEMAEFASAVMAEEGIRYWISPGGDSITCTKCRNTSRNPNDVSNRYCGHCRVFHEERAGNLSAPSPF